MKLLVILFFTLLSFNAFSERLPHTKLYAVTDGFCCGGEESDPHAVYGFEVMNNGFVLSGKSIDSEGTEEGFVIKFPDNLPDDRIFLSPDEEHSFDWVYLFGSPGKRDGANGAISIFDSVFDFTDYCFNIIRVDIRSGGELYTSVVIKTMLMHHVIM